MDEELSTPGAPEERSEQQKQIETVNTSEELLLKARAISQEIQDRVGRALNGENW
jgi:hypothetical protein